MINIIVEIIIKPLVYFLTTCAILIVILPNVNPINLLFIALATLNVYKMVRVFQDNYKVYKILERFRRKGSADMVEYINKRNKDKDNE